MKSFWLLVLIAFVVLPITATQAADRSIAVRHKGPQSETDNRPRYFVDLLHATLEATRSDYGAYNIEQTPEFISQSRALWLLERNRSLDVVWTMTSNEREQQVMPIRIPLMKGLLGVRLLLINPDKQADFAKVNSLSELRRYIAVQGHDWPDTKILMANQLVVKTDQRYDELFKLVELGRYGFFPRGVLEIYEELKQHPDSRLVIEPHLVIAYPSPIYFFVNKENHYLAERLEVGLRRLIANGEFDRLLSNHALHRNALQSMHLEKRTLIKLKNPGLPPDTPLNDPTLWWDMDLFQ